MLSSARSEGVNLLITIGSAIDTMQLSDTRAIPSQYFTNWPFLLINAIAGIKFRLILSEPH